MPHFLFAARTDLFSLDSNNYIYHGQRDFGIQFAGSFWENLACKQGLTWDMPTEFYTDTGKRFGGSDYYSGMILWWLPAALQGQDLSGPAQPGGLVDRIIRAAQGG